LVDIKIWDDYSKTKSRELRNEIIENYYKYVNYIVNRLMIKKPDGITRDDLVQLGLMGLMEAVDRYDYTVGAKFESFATKYIHGRIVDEIRKYVSTNGGPTRTTLAKIKRVEEAIRHVENRIQRDATLQEIAEELDMSIDEYYKLLGDITVATTLSLDKMVGIDENMPAIEVIPDENSVQPEKELMKKEKIEKLIKEISALPPKEHRIIVSYYYEDLTLKEISYQLGLTQGRISQLHANTLLRLKSRMEG